jgi:hypothetical protein
MVHITKNFQLVSLPEKEITVIIIALNMTLNRLSINSVVSKRIQKQCNGCLRYSQEKVRPSNIRSPYYSKFDGTGGKLK